MAAGLTQEKLGVAAGIDEASASARMNQYEKGTHAPNYEMSEKFAKVLVPVEYLYARDDQVAALLLAFSKLDKERPSGTSRKRPASSPEKPPTGQEAPPLTLCF